MAPKPTEPKADANAAATPPDAEKAKPTFGEELLNNMIFSPPFLVAWALGYFSDFNMFLALFLMMMPMLTSRTVEALGGRGAWAKKVKAAKEPNRASKRADAKGNPLPPPVEEVPLVEHLQLPTSVWAPPLMLLFFTKTEDDSEYADMKFVTNGIAVYVTMIAGQYAMRKMGLLKY